jgi:NADPH:quinone reductase-like Zn-dependent oxidoreductase
LAIVPIPEAGLGIEAAGVVRRVSPKAKNLRPGDRVMLLGDGSFATQNITSEKLCIKIPDRLSFEDAATMPAVYATALCALIDIGNLQRDQVIHICY